ncbi:hypothetical protein [Streptomyces natalensis]|uniref:Membrane protein SCJ1.26 n=1 Tax=Streptomyces natalensis ATCC 27448 TaxID=1240678 RepID=A0A0D7CGD3_9ACTN|nr:hypothetical protein [Streptomyces natalensis]KIZ14925.1 hypothetical protein SNA_31205 [Streptomyces natalensis ATCC 27448]
MPLGRFLARFRRGPLWRGCDVAQAWLVLITALLIAVAAPAAGVTAAQAVAGAAARQSHDRHGVAAVVTEDPPVRIGADPTGGVGGRVHATVRWTSADGASRTGVTTVPSDLRAGDRTTAWLDGRGVLLRNPVTDGEARIQSIAVGTVASGGTCLLLLAGERGGRALIDRRRYALWEREWAAGDTQWGRREAGW